MLKYAVLASLLIKNFALMERLSIEFSPRLNVLTGETGAGKSILIDAIRFVLGERVEGLQAGGEKPCSVEAAFEITQKEIRSNEAAAPFFESSEDTLLVLKREFQSDRTRCWVNQRPVNLSALKQIGALLIDIHGQHDHQLLFDPSSHIEMIDRFARLETAKQTYAFLYEEYRDLVRNRTELLALEEGREREIDLLKYQIEEIERAKLKEGEDEKIQVERIRLANAEKLNEAAARVLSFLNEEEESVSSLVAKAYRDMNQLAKLDPSLETLKSEYETAQLQIEEVIRSLKDYQEGLSFDADTLEEMDKRLDLIDLLKRKYGGSTTKVLEYFEQSKKKFDQLSNSTVYRDEIDKKLKTLTPKLKEAADFLTDNRKKASMQLKKMIETELKDLGIPNAAFECQIEPCDFGTTGADKLEFVVRLNAGQPFFSVRKIISGGEASRFMLAMKRALIKIDPVPTLIFDEIDANIGGRLGSITGSKLKAISDERQVLLITHLPQIASFAERHFKVTKSVHQGKTAVEYKTIEGEERVRELAQMMSGKDETEISKLHAKEMLSRVTEKK